MPTTYPKSTRAILLFPKPSNSPAPNYAQPFQLIILSSHINSRNITSLTRTWSQTYHTKTHNPPGWDHTLTTKLFHKPALTLVWSTRKSLTQQITTYQQNLPPTQLLSNRLPLHTNTKPQLKTNIALQTDREQILKQFTNIIKHKANKQNTYNHSHKLKSLFPHAIFAPIDHNTRQSAILCQRRLHDELDELYYKDHTHFKHIVTGTTLKDGSTVGEDVEKSIHKFVTSRRSTDWFKYTWTGKQERLSYLYITFKEDGVRVRPIGSSTPLAHKTLLSHISTALCAILRHSGLTHHTYHQTFDLKPDIANIQRQATSHNLFIHKQTWDIKNFYTEINKHMLITRITYILDYYKQHNKTCYISIPKYKHKSKHKPKTGRDNSGMFHELHLGMILDVIIFSLDTAFFKLGAIFLLQVLGLVMGNPLSPNLAQCFVAFDEHHHSLINWSINTNIVHVFQKRFMDDAIAIILTADPDNTHVLKFFEFTANDFYEHDQPSHKRRFVLVPSKDGNKYLDSDIIVTKDARSIKIAYHNKNASILETHEQDVGRFLDKHACTPYTQKITAVANVLARAHRFTSHEQDLVQTLTQIQHECALLHYTASDMRLMITATVRMLHKTDPCELYIHLARRLRKQQYTM